MTTKTTRSTNKRVSKTTNGIRRTTNYSSKGTSNSQSAKTGNTRVTHTRLADGSFRNTTSTNVNGYTNRSTQTISSPKFKPKRLKITSYKEKSARSNSESDPVINYLSNSISGDSVAAEPIIFCIGFLLIALLFGIVAGKLIYVLSVFAVLGGVYGLGKWFFREREVSEEPKEESNKLLGFATAVVILCLFVPFIDMIVRAL